jgi:hypothetical protein
MATEVSNTDICNVIRNKIPFIKIYQFDSSYNMALDCKIYRIRFSLYDSDSVLCFEWSHSSYEEYLSPINVSILFCEQFIDYVNSNISKIRTPNDVTLHMKSDNDLIRTYCKYLIKNKKYSDEVLTDNKNNNSYTW